MPIPKFATVAPLLSDRERVFASAIRQMSGCNLFLPERIRCEQEALGAAFVAEGADWNRRTPPDPRQTANVRNLGESAAALVGRVRAIWPADGRLPKEDGALYEQVVLYWLFQRYCPQFDTVIKDALEGRNPEGRVGFYPAFRRDAEAYLHLPGLHLTEEFSVSHIFATCFQIRRAFFHIYWFLVGASEPVARLRAAIWQSIFTHDMGRHHRVLRSRMGDFATLITGPSGTGKELVARAIALSRFLPYDANRGGFGPELAGLFYPLNLSALSPTLIESELFGHRRGAFTGAQADHTGWLEVCPAAGTVFLDEVAEVDSTVQVKLLRVLQTREFQRLGETGMRRFAGKIIAASNRDLPAEIRAGRFREDFYYRLCSDQITTPSLREQLDAAPGDLYLLVEFIVEHLLAKEEAARFTQEACDWIQQHLGADYTWPGNFRELEQCVRNLLIRRDYHPAGPFQRPAESDWNHLIESGELTAEELLQRYTRIVYAKAGTIEETARRLYLDRRTVKASLAAVEPEETRRRTVADANRS